MSCPNCGMYVCQGYFDKDWALHEGPRWHECPKPFPLEVAKSIVSTAVGTGAPVHPRTKARCVLAYKEAGLL